MLNLKKLLLLLVEFCEELFTWQEHNSLRLHEFQISLIPIHNWLRYPTRCNTATHKSWGATSPLWLNPVWWRLICAGPWIGTCRYVPFQAPGICFCHIVGSCILISSSEFFISFIHLRLSRYQLWIRKDVLSFPFKRENLVIQRLFIYMHNINNKYIYTGWLGSM